MICFGAKKKPKSERKGNMWVPLENKTKIKTNQTSLPREREREKQREREIFLFFYFFLLSLLSSIYRNRTVRIHRDKKQSDILDEGYAWEPKTRDFAEFLIKIRKILCFVFSQIYGFLPVRIGRSRRLN